MKARRARHPSRYPPASNAICRSRQPVTVQVIIDGDNANTASTVDGLRADR